MVESTRSGIYSEKYRKGNSICLNMPHIIQLSGGLGNQMFQYAYALALKSRTGSADGIYLDLDWFDDVRRHTGVTVREFDLSHFNISLPILPEKNRTTLLRKAKGRKRPHVLSKLLHLKKYPRVFLMQEMLQAMQSDAKIRVDGYFHGITCCDEFFRHLKKELQQDLILKEPLNEANARMLDEIRSHNSVAIHVRRTDFLTTPGVSICSRQYYEKAIESIVNHTENARFYIFSDDLNWVSENLLIKAPHTLVNLNDGDHGFFDFWLMKHCMHHIIANSTFSWWAAWLCETENHLVMAPASDHLSSSEMGSGIEYPSDWENIQGWQA